MTNARTPTRLSWVALAAFVAICAPVGLVTCAPHKPPATLHASESWCPDGFEVGPRDTCFAVPADSTKDTPILIYLHGPHEGHGASEEWELVKSAKARGFAVVVPRGKRGLCALTAELKASFCWPHETDDPQPFKALVGEWERVLWQVDAILESGTHKRYVLGFSNGGFFAAYLAEHGLFAAEAYAIVGSGGPPGPALKRASPAPVLLLHAEGDLVESARVKELHDELGKVAWPHAFCTRPGSAVLAATDIEASLDFFKRVRASLPKPNAATYPCEAGTSPAEPSPAPARVVAPAIARDKARPPVRPKRPIKPRP